MGARNWISRLPARLLEIAALPRWIRQLGVHAREARSAPLPPMAVHLVALLGRLDLHAGFVVDIGAGDGIAVSPTLPLFRSPAWRGLGIEPDPDKFCRLSVAFAFREGYVRRPGRRRLFPHNADMDDLLEMSPEHALEAIRDRFRAYHGRFILEREAAEGGGMSETPGGRGRVDHE